MCLLLFMFNPIRTSGSWNMMMLSWDTSLDGWVLTEILKWKEKTNIIFFPPCYFIMLIDRHGNCVSDSDTSKCFEGTVFVWKLVGSSKAKGQQRPAWWVTLIHFYSVWVNIKRNQTSAVCLIKQHASSGELGVGLKDHFHIFLSLT